MHRHPPARRPPAPLPSILAVLLVLAATACGRDDPAPAVGRTEQVTARTPSGPTVAPFPRPAPAQAQGPAGDRPDMPPLPAPSPAAPAATPVTAPVAAAPAPASPSDRTPPDPAQAREVLAGMRTLATAGNTSALAPFLPRRDRSFAQRPVDEILESLGGRVTGAEVQGGRVVLRLDAGEGRERRAVFLARPQGFLYDASASAHWAAADPGPAELENRELSLDEALAGVPGTGAPVATLDTTAGTVRCRLLADIAPLSVAAFVGLARGRRAFLDPGTGTWVRRPFYDDQPFFRATAGAWATFGCTDVECRTGPGFSVPDELDLGTRFDGPGRLAWDAAPPNAGGGRVVLTAAPDRERDDRATIFGLCGPDETVTALTVAASREGRKEPAVRIRTVTFSRGEAAAP